MSSIPTDHQSSIASAPNHQASGGREPAVLTTHSSSSASQLRNKLLAAGQEHVWSGFDSLPAERQESFLAELAAVPLEDLRRLWKAKRSGTTEAGESSAQKAERAQTPAQIIRLPDTPVDHSRWLEAKATGEQALRDGRVAVLVVAGGQGTRLGFDHPKGMFPIGPVSGKSLFQIFCEQIRKRSVQAGRSIPYYVMTSSATHDETVAFFREQHNFGLPDEDVRFFQQGNLPALDAETGQLLLAGPGELALSPDGHGGVLAAMQQAGLLEDMRQRGIDLLYYQQVDNPQARIAEPEFLGWHLLQASELSTKVVAKTGPEEKMGLVCDVDGQAQIIEYSDLPKSVAERRTATGALELWAGNTALHIFSRPFLERLLTEPDSLPLHVAHKPVAWWSPEEGAVTPQSPNAFKFERFIFDALPRAQRTLVVETARRAEFNPVKNATGVNSPDDVRQALQLHWRDWAEEAGIQIPSEQTVEISPLFALSATEFCDQIRHGAHPQITESGWLYEAQ